MGRIDDIDKTRKQVANIYTPSDLRIEKLRAILRQEQGHDISFIEAENTARKLVRLYRALAGDRTVTRGGLKNRDRIA